MGYINLGIQISVYPVKVLAPFLRSYELLLVVSIIELYPLIVTDATYPRASS